MLPGRRLGRREAGHARPGIDAHGNLWALPGDWDGALVSAGSHVDTVPDGGRHDGALGTVLALELAQELREGTAGGARPALLVCAAEEAPRFGAGTVGSRLLAGTLRDERGLRRAASTPTAHGRAAQRPRRVPGSAGRAPARATGPGARRRSRRGPRRSATHAAMSLGVVTRVASPRRFRVTDRADRRSGHSGEVSMEDRHDALAAAAELVLAVEAAARAEPPQTVATAGTLEVAPGAISVIPGRARLGIDARGVDCDSARGLRGGAFELTQPRSPLDARSTSRSSSCAQATRSSSTAEPRRRRGSGGRARPRDRGELNMVRLGTRFAAPGCPVPDAADVRAAPRRREPHAARRRRRGRHRACFPIVVNDVLLAAFQSK